MPADSPWPLRLDLISAKALVWVASVGRDAELTQDAHIFFFDRYQRLAQFHKQHGHHAASKRLQAKADEHYRASGGTEPPFAAAMAMPRPRRWITVDVVAGRHPSDSDDAA
jgi:hypothetical protein